MYVDLMKNNDFLLIKNRGKNGAVQLLFFRCDLF